MRAAIVYVANTITVAVKFRVVVMVVGKRMAGCWRRQQRDGRAWRTEH
ncbi:MAG: hypothetical protein OXG82_04360 [Gammaproteobacteria bacterium]|nr:hypothetical protein [Gammaproteobacteria bacterium]